MKCIATFLDLTRADYAAHLWDFSVDDDFPVEHLPLQVEVMTRTAMNDHGEVRTLSAEEWMRKKEAYEPDALREKLPPRRAVLPAVAFPNAPLRNSETLFFRYVNKGAGKHQPQRGTIHTAQGNALGK